MFQAASLERWENWHNMGPLTVLYALSIANGLISKELRRSKKINFIEGILHRLLTNHKPKVKLFFRVLQKCQVTVQMETLKSPT